MKDSINKYYTPDMEEYHIGFEYECSADKGELWYHNKLETIADFYTLEDDLRYDLVRVKHLNKEDIESLGFKCNYTDQYFKGDDTILVDDDFFMQIIRRKEDSVDEAYLFQGTIKNKSELKKLLKQLNIC